MNAPRKPTCAILMAVYRNDDPADLNLALKSIGPDQSHAPDLICIVFDGPVPDSLRDTVAQFDDANGILVETLALPENRGLSFALRLGLRHLRERFDYVIRTDADDISRPTRIADQIAFMEAHPEVALASSQVSIFEGQPDNIAGKRHLPSGPELDRFALSRTPINHSASILRSASVLDIDYPETRLPFEDWWISLRILKAGGKIDTIDEVHLDFRGGADMISRRRGWRYMRQEITYFRQIHAEGLMSTGRVARNLAQRLVLRMLPAPAMRLLYRLKMHK